MIIPVEILRSVGLMHTPLVLPLSSLKKDPCHLDFTRRICGNTVIVWDASNTFNGAPQTQNGSQGLDVLAMKRMLGGDNLVGAYASVSRPSMITSSQLGFYRFLQHSGFTLLESRCVASTSGLRENEEIADGNVRRAIRDAACREDVESIVLLSGDGGMINAVRYARRCGKNVFVAAWAGTLHNELAKASTSHIAINDLIPIVGFRKYH